MIGELQSADSPAEVQQWLARKPDRINIHRSDTPKSYITDLGLGEREAIYLATKLGVDTLLMDDAKGGFRQNR